MANALATQYKETIAPALQQEFGYKNIMQVPTVQKVTLNVGYGRHVKDKAYIDNVDKTLAQITGQKPVHNKAKKSISNFKIREGMPVGASVTLRGEAMFNFLNKLINVTFPRVRDFRGIKVKSVGKDGNFSYGFKENIAFPEITADAVERIHGVEVTITTSATSREEGLALLKGFGMPFQEKK